MQRSHSSHHSFRTRSDRRQRLAQSPGLAGRFDLREYDEPLAEINRLGTKSATSRTKRSRHARATVRDQVRGGAALESVRS